MTAPLPRPHVGRDSDKTLIDGNESLIETAAGIPQPVSGDNESNTDLATVALRHRSIAETGSSETRVCDRPVSPTMSVGSAYS